MELIWIIFLGTIGTAVCQCLHPRQVLHKDKMGNDVCCVPKWCPAGKNNYVYHNNDTISLQV